MNKLFGKGTKQRAINGGLDNYYTNPTYATHCTELVKKVFNKKTIKHIVEPSAGNGAFSSGIKNLVGLSKWSINMYDLEPQVDFITKANFFDVSLQPNTLVIGNPPFGFSANLAIKFFNHAASFKAVLIAFILPRTFKKDSVKNKLNKHYHLIYEEDCPKNCFLLEGSPYNVPCVFQIWKYLKKERYINMWQVDNKWLEFTDQKEAEFCIRRVGGKAGQILEGDPLKYSTTSTYFCKEKIPGVKDVIKNIDFSEIVNSTVGVRSLSKRELHKKLYEYYQKD